MPLHVPTESWMEIFKWLEEPAQIQSISLVNYWFYDIIYTNLAKKYEEEKHWKKMPDLRFSRYFWPRGGAKLCELETKRPLPIAEVSPPKYIRPFNQVYIRHFDEQVLSFFTAIRQWFQQGFLLAVKFEPLTRKLIRTADFAKFQMFVRQALLGHCLGLDCVEKYSENPHQQPIGYLLDEDFVLTIPIIRFIAFEDAFMIRWLFTPITDGAQRVWILWTLKREMKNRIVQEFTNATVAQKFIIIFRPLQSSDARAPIEETRNQRTQECLRYFPNSIIDGCWECIIRQPISEGAPDLKEINRAFYDLVGDGFPSNDRPTICLFAPECLGTAAAAEMASGSSRLQ